ncbi:MAG: HD domain-containing protein [Promethearchaeia archaeon]
MRKKFETLLKQVTDPRTLKRAQRIKKSSLNIIEINKSESIVKATIQGSKVVPYKLNLNLSNGVFSKSIEHDCSDYLHRRKKRGQFCKHLAVLFQHVFDQDNHFACTCLKQLIKQRENALLSLEDNGDLNHFISPEIEENLHFECHGFQEFFEKVNLDKITRNKLELILTEAKQYPAALGGHHGAYQGGLFDHILLVTNYAYYLHKTMHNQTDLKRVVLTAIYHDFGKISYYGYKKSIPGRRVRISRTALRDIQRYIQLKYQYSGKDPHVESALGVVRKFNLPADREIERGIIFHHGSWSKYKPNAMNKIATVVHVADMMASQVLYI